ncbi:MAG: alanine racemase [Gammaproteobacteria bacterium]|jgi:alanine racemase
MSRPGKVVIHLAALRHNLSRVMELAPGSRVMAVVKADAYGHGLVRAAKALAGADSFGVACLEEAEQLREAGITHPLVLLEGPFAADELPRIAALGLEMAVHHEEQLRMLEAARLTAPVKVWLKLDSGMHRLGFAPDAVQGAWERLRECASVDPDIVLMSHMANAGDRTSTLVREQLACFDAVAGDLGCPRSMANSAGIIHWPGSRYDYIRPGLMLYGVSPMDDTVAADHGLLPVMCFESCLISIKHLRRGDPVGYGAAWSCPEDMPVGIVAAGYGDGFPRHAGSGTPVIINGMRSQIVGNASMDMLNIDLRPQPLARIGDPVQLWGDLLPVEEVARHAGTIPYELLCGVQPRLQFIERD